MILPKTFQIQHSNESPSSVKVMAKNVVVLSVTEGTDHLSAASSKDAIQLTSSAV